MNDHMRPGDAGYLELYAAWKRDEGTTFQFQGSFWTAIRDNDVIVFHRTGSESGLDSAYEDYTVFH